MIFSYWVRIHFLMCLKLFRSQCGVSSDCVCGFCLVSSSIVRCRSVLRSKSVWLQFAFRSTSLTVSRRDVHISWNVQYQWFDAHFWSVRGRSVIRLKWIYRCSWSVCSKFVVSCSKVHTGLWWVGWLCVIKWNLLRVKMTVRLVCS